MDFSHDRLLHGRAFRALTALDEFCRYGLAVEIEFSFVGATVVAILERLAARHGYPTCLRLDNGPELRSDKVNDWADDHGVMRAAEAKKDGKQRARNAALHCSSQYTGRVRMYFGKSLFAKEWVMIRTLGASALALALLGTGIAMAAQPTPVPNTPPDFTSMRFLLGTWTCHQTLPGRAGDRTETDTYTMAYDGWQMQDHFVSPPFDTYRNRDIVGDSWLTWDPKLKLWINQNVDNFGTYGLLTSHGWTGNKITWSTTNPDGTVGRTVETKVSDTKEIYASWYNDKKGQSLKAGLSQTCKKS